MAELLALAGATNTLCSTPAEERPLVAEYIATIISDNGAALSTPKGSLDQAASPVARGPVVDKLRARILALTQDRTVEGRWAALVLVKAILEAGQWEILRGFGNFVQPILHILGKPDPLSAKKLSILTLTRIYQLAHQYQTLTREITTPTLPQFITLSLDTISTKAANESRRTLKSGHSLVETVLCSFLTLLPNHPTIFRPFSTQILDLILPLLTISYSPEAVPGSTKGLAQQLFISLHQCAPKNTASDEWNKAVRNTILAAHRTCDHLFRSIVEHWESVDPSLRQGTGHMPSGSAIGDEGPDPLGLPKWIGVQQGSGQLISLLGLLSQFIKSRTHSTVSLPVGLILDLTSRLASITVPSTLDDKNAINPEFDKSERETLWGIFPTIHTACLGLQRTVFQLCGPGGASSARSCLDQILWIFSSSNFSRLVREAVYKSTSTSLAILGPTLTKPGALSLAPIIQASCNDLMRPHGSGSSEGQVSGTKGKTGSLGTTNADAFLNSKLKKNLKHQSISAPETLTGAATTLVVDALKYVPTELITFSLRAKIDRTSILTANKDLMLASVLNPLLNQESQRGHSSILPFLARSHSDNIAIEGLLRPRVPVIVTGAGRKGRLEIESDDEGDNEATTRGLTDISQSRMREALAEKLGSRQAPGKVEAPLGIDKGSKRGYPEESDIMPQSTVPQPDKRARVEKTAPANLVAVPETQIPFGTRVQRNDEIEKSSKNLLRESEEAKYTNLEDIPQSKPLSPDVSERTGTAEPETDSDDEIPQLNMESDTDENEEQ